MSILEDLQSADNWSIRYGLWDKLFVGTNLFNELSQLASSQIDDAVASIEKDNADALEADKRPEWEWVTARSLMVCAQIAYLTGKTPENLMHLLQKLNPQAQISDVSDWQNFVKTSLYQFSWPKPLSAEWAWDAVSAFSKTPRRALRTVKTTVLLLENNAGIAADLTLELIEQGRGRLYVNPQTMSFVLLGNSFLQAEENAVAFVQEQGVWPETRDIRWMITRKSPEPIFEINGGSVGGAFALGLMKLLGSDL